MEKLLARVHEQDEFIGEFVKELVDRVMSDIKDDEYTKEELMAYTSTIQSKVNSQIAYHLVALSVWKANNLKR